MEDDVKAKWRRIRTDYHTHHKTRGLSLLARDLMLQGIAQECPSGILCRGPVAMAELAGPGASAPKVRAAIAELEQRGLVRWWPKLEILWVIEATDENVDNDSMLEPIRRRLLTLPVEVRKAYVARYPHVVGGVAFATPEPLRAPHPTWRLRDEPAANVVELRPKDGDGGRANEFLMQWHVRYCELRRELKFRDVGSPLRGGERFEGLRSALDAYGWETVWEVLEYTYRQLAVKAIPPAFLTQMFVRSGFEARLHAWSEHKDKPAAHHLTAEEIERMI